MIDMRRPRFHAYLPYEQERYETGRGHVGRAAGDLADAAEMLESAISMFEEAGHTKASADNLRRKINRVLQLREDLIAFLDRDEESRLYRITQATHAEHKRGLWD